MIMDREKLQMFIENPVPKPITNLTWTTLGLNFGLRSENTLTDCLNYGMA
jgi:hypothetical protein